MPGKLWERLQQVDPGHLWWIRSQLREALVNDVRARLRRSWHERGASDAWQAEEAARAALCRAREVLPPEVPREVIAGIGIACVLLPSAPAVLPVSDAGVVEGGPDAG